MRSIVSAPFLHLTKGGERITLKGQPACSLGHQLHREGGRKPDGIFAEWLWDGKRLRVQNDRYGFYPLYYFIRPGEVCVSPSLVQLLSEGAPTAPDVAALAVFLRVGWFIGEDTPFQHIRAFPPDAVLEWDDGTVRIVGNTELGQLQAMGRDEAIDEFIARFKAAVRRRLPADDDFAVLLSGGRDSRQILFELCEAGCRPPFCITARFFPPQSDEDVRVAALVTHALGIRHVIVEQPASRFSAELRNNLRTNFCADEHSWALPIADYLEGRVNTAYDGIAGDTLTGGNWRLNEQVLALYGSGRFADLAAWFFGAIEGALSKLLTPTFLAQVNRELAIEHLASRLKDHAGAPNPIDSFLFWHTIRREIALNPYGVLAGVKSVFNPYLDHDVYDLLASLPASMFLDHRFHDDAMRRAYPQYAALPFRQADAAPRSDAVHAKRLALELAWFGLSHRRSRFVRPQALIQRLSRELRIRALYLLQLEWLVRRRAAADLSEERIGPLKQQGA